MTILRLVLNFIPFVTVAAYTSHVQAQSNGPMALVGATLINGTGAPAMSDAVILIANGRILRVGPRSQVPIPDGADPDLLAIAGHPLRFSNIRNVRLAIRDGRLVE
jgi:hypothetical protein